MSSASAQYITPVKELLKNIKRANQGKRRSRITILGAGMAGLGAAYELMQLGHQVEIFEASDRIGGRVYTHRFADGTHAELGAMRVPVAQDYTFHYINAFGLPVGRFYNTSPNGYYDALGVVTQIKHAAKNLYPLFDLSDQDRQLADRGGPGAVTGKYLNRLVDSLSPKVIQSLFDLADQDPRRYAARAMIDNSSYLNYLLKQVDTQGALHMAGVLQSLEELWETSLTIRVRGSVARRGNDLYEIEGGMSRLPQAMADELRNNSATKLELNTAVTDIDVSDSGVNLKLRDTGTGDCRSVRSDLVLCTIPFAVLRTINISGVSQAKHHAIRTLNYASSSKVLLHCRERFWQRAPYSIVGGSSISQHISRQTYYPNDHHPHYRQVWEGDQSNTDIHAFHQDPGPGSDLATAEAMAHEPGVLLASYTWGMEARRIGALGPQARIEQMIRSIARFHPEIEQYVDDGASVFWDDQPWALGAYAHPMPHDLDSAFPSVLSAESGLYFAGEHLSPDPGWIQGALFSSLSNVLSLLDRLPTA